MAMSVLRKACPYDLLKGLQALNSSLGIIDIIIQQAERVENCHSLHDQIIKNAKLLESCLKYVRALCREGTELPDMCEQAIQNVHDNLMNCESYLQDADLSPIVDCTGYENNLQALADGLGRSVATAELAVSIAIFGQVGNLKQFFQHEFMSLRRDIYNPQGGIFFGSHNQGDADHDGSGDHMIPEAGCARANRALSVDSAFAKLPHAISPPEVEQNDPGCVSIQWMDHNNKPEELIRYEVEFDDVWNLCIPVPPQCSEVTLCPPLLEYGKLYTIRVRAVNSMGKGQLSDPGVVVQLASGPPKAPARKPSVDVLLDDQHKKLTAKLSLELDTPETDTVSTCVVEWCRQGDKEWHKKEHPLSPDSGVIETVSVDGLESNSTYHFRMKYKNQYGESSPSQPKIVKTEELVPSTPINFQVVERTHNVITLQWEKPDSNAESIQHYKISKRRRESIWIPAVLAGSLDGKTAADQLSATVMDLKPNTRYYFELAAVTSSNKLGEAAETKSRTLRHPAVRGLLAAGAFTGVVLTAPVTVPVYHVASGMHSVNELYEKDRKAAAQATIKTISGAVYSTFASPVLGPVAGIDIAKRIYKDDKTQSRKELQSSSQQMDKSGLQPSSQQKSKDKSQSSSQQKSKDKSQSSSQRKSKDESQPSSQRKPKEEPKFSSQQKPPIKAD